MSKKVKVKRSAEHLSHYLPTEILAAVENSMNEEAGRIAYCERDLKKHLRRYAKGLKLVLPLMIDTKTKQLIEFYGKKSKVKDLDRPHDLDHFIKEKLHIKYYIRYMDDFILIHKDIEYLKYCKKQIEAKLAALGLVLSRKKTQISRIKQPIHFLGFSFRPTESGKIVMKVLPNKVVKERRKLKKLVDLSKKGVMTRYQVDECFKSWKAHASKGNCYKLIQSMTQYYNDLWRC